MTSKSDHSIATSGLVRVGTRESVLAKLQTEIVVRTLTNKFPLLKFEIVHITTGGDKVQDRPIAQLGGRGVFVKELEEALYDHRVDIVVHSLKDLPTEVPNGLTLSAVLNRADPRDVLVSKNNHKLLELPTGSRVATSSRRRTAQMKALRPDLDFCDIRGNIPTRLRKHDEGQCDAMILAAAGLERLEMNDRISQYFAFEESTPAVGQGALGVESRLDDERISTLMAAIDEPNLRQEITAERAFLDKLGGGCSVPVGAIALTLSDGTIKLTGCVAALDGSRVIRETVTDKATNAFLLGERLAALVLDKGAESILRELKQSVPAAISPP